MRKNWRRVGIGMGVAALAVACTLVATTVQSQPPAVKESAEKSPPADQNYVGAKACSSCHFKQYVTWKKTKHAKEAWEVLPAKYRTAAECLPCHSTGYGRPTGFKDAESTPALVGTACEACHGPGSAHAQNNKQFLGKKSLTDEEKKVAHSTIHRVLPGNVCAACHVVQGHKDHPAYDKE
jgi:hypothetical protein